MAGLGLNRGVAVLVASSLVFSSTAAVAQTAAPAAQVNPWAALTAMSGGAPAAALCGAAATVAAAQAANGCVLPVTDVVAGPPTPVPVPPVEAPSGLGLNPLYLALGALAAAALLYFLLRHHHHHPVSPA